MDLCTADDVKCLLQDAMPTTLSLPTVTKPTSTSAKPLGVRPPGAAGSGMAALIASAGPPAGSDTVVMPSGTTYPMVPAVPSAAAAPALTPAGIGVGYPMPHPGDGSIDFSKTEMVTPETSLNMSVSAFLSSLGLEQLREVFDREQISVDILAEMGHEDLKQIGVSAFGHRHKLIKGIEKLVSGNGIFFVIKISLQFLRIIMMC